jgi:predicted transposase/invertase (TIGR01784 family)
MKTDSIFYQLVQAFPVLLFELLDLDPDLARGYEFSSREVKELAFRYDGVFVPTQQQGPLYFVEVQFQPDPDLYYRLLAEIHLYLRQYQPGQGWLAVVIYPHAAIDLGLPVDLQGSASQIQGIYLDRLKASDSPLLDLVHLIVSPPAQAENQA